MSMKHIDFYMHVNVFWLQKCIGKEKKVICTIISLFFLQLALTGRKKKKKKAAEAEPSLERF